MPSPPESDSAVIRITNSRASTGPWPEVGVAVDHAEDRAGGADNTDRRREEGEQRARDAAREVQSEEPIASDYQLEPRSEEVEPQHVEEQVGRTGMQEHVRDDGPWVGRDESGNELQALHEARGPLLEQEHRDVGDDEAQHPRRHARAPGEVEFMAMNLARRILLADADAFYVSVARLVDPEGAGKALLLIVGGSAERRGVVTSASYEARRYGVHSAMPMARAIRLCPKATVVPVPWEACADKSRQIKTVLEQFTPAVEQASSDEFYLDMTGTAGRYRDEPPGGKRPRGAPQAGGGPPGAGGLSGAAAPPG